jgi:RNA polymerase sigma factor (sigma-70 family)
VPPEPVQSMPERHPLIERLAADHQEHLVWLRRRMRGRLAPDEAEDMLQAAYAKALRALQASRVDGGLDFGSVEEAGAWLRTIAVNLAIDDDRRRHGRVGPARPDTMRPRLVAEHERLAVDAGVDVEDHVVGVVAREADQRLVARALTTLAPEHRQILQLRYGWSLEPGAIMLLERISRRQWDGRHTRAVKALVRALARLHLTAECRQTRGLLRRSPAALLQRGGDGSAARAHVDACLACGAFARCTQAALAVAPLPLPIEEWRFEILEYFGRPVRPPSAPADGGGHAVGASGTSGASAVAALALVAASLAAAGGLIGLERAGRSSSDGSSNVDPGADVRRGGSTRWADHATGRQALERSLRGLSVRRADVERRVRNTRARSARRAVAGPPAETPRIVVRAPARQRRPGD